MNSTHDVFNQSTPLEDINLFSGNQPLQQALQGLLPGHDRERFAAMGAELGSAAMQAHARLANVHLPQLHSHDRFGHRVDRSSSTPATTRCWKARCSTNCMRRRGALGRVRISSARWP